LMLFAVVALAILAYAGIDLLSEKKQISNMIAALLLIVLGVTFILTAVQLWLSVTMEVLSVGGKEYVAILTDDFSKLIGAVGLGTAGMAVITGGFSLISGGKYEVKVSSTSKVKGVKIEE